MTRENRVYAAWVVAILATMGSLYFSEVRQFVPCVLCWFQRICMYPLVLVLGVAAFRADPGGRAYALPLAVAGWLVAMVHNLEDWGVIQALKVCGVGQTTAGCDAKWPIFGDANKAVSDIITIPVLSFVAFTLVIALLTWRERPGRR
ncbi:disulfide bond formation protein B [Deinococcus maricopensis]|uniref:Disulfide bond formation protein DsbB n=1 Tax=Deinococcus maricopensis (strain DSM 21211 / LMG 22137 / NRRL B-23946 / LB-34) TaxID=709986 RepID=E8U8K8_DEIML|nr:disulfide bond formation protein B [Deinococcus maricopensis]ADV67397.1 disulfide bond formation protein DsbB [Deinococcus maricopensis DSM 21211]